MEKFIFAVVGGYVLAALLTNFHIRFSGQSTIATPTVPYGGQGVPTASTTVAPVYTTTTPVAGGISPYNLVTGGTLPTAGNYDQSRVTPCVTGDC